MLSHSPKYGVVETPTPNEAVPKEGTPKKPRSKLAELFLGMPGIIAGAALGILLGVLIQRAKPNAEVISWIGVPGDLFIRALKCIIPPLVFATMIVGMADMHAVGKAGAIGWKTFWLYTITTMIATAEGVIAVILFRPLFKNEAKTATVTIAEFAMGCADPGYYLSHAANGTVSCMFDPTYNATKKFSPSSKFLVTDINSAFAKTAS